MFVISSSDLEYWSSFDPDLIAERNANQTSINLARCANELKVFTLFFVALLIVAMVSLTYLEKLFSLNRQSNYIGLEFIFYIQSPFKLFPNLI